MSMHAARLSQSPRLQRMLAFLRDRPLSGCTGREFVLACEVLNPATYVSELRKNGFNIECSYERTTEGGRSVHRYRLIE